MKKTIKRWLVNGIPGVATSVALFYASSTQIYLYAIAMQVVALLIGALIAVDIIWRIRYATRVAVLIHSRTGVWHSRWDCLDVPKMPHAALVYRLEVFESNRELISDPLYYLSYKEE